MVLVIAMVLASVPVLTDGSEAEGTPSATPDLSVYRYTPKLTVTSEDWGSIEYIAWDFGDGTVLDGRWIYYQMQDADTLTDEQKAGLEEYERSLIENGGSLFETTHTYSEQGIYTVTMVVMNPRGYIAPNQTVGYGTEIDEDHTNYDDTGYDGGLTSDVASDITKPSEDDFSKAEFRAVAGAWHRTIYTVEILGYPTVTFDSNEGSEVDPITVENGSTYISATKPADPVRSGYTFDGWFTDEDCTEPYDWSLPVEKPMTLYAGWTEIVYITVTADGKSFTLTGGSRVSDLDIPEKERHTFAGWFSDAECSVSVDKDTVLTDGMVLYAKWDPNKVTVTAEGKQIVVYEGSKVSVIGIPAKEGFVFAGWFSDTECSVSVDNDTVLTDGMTLYAKWNPAKITVTVDGKVLTVDNGTKVSDLTVPEKKGYEFSGWYSDRGCTVSLGKDTVLTDGMTVFSKSTAKTVFGTSVTTVAVCILGLILVMAGIRFHPVILVAGAAVLVYGALDMFGFIGGFL